MSVIRGTSLTGYRELVGELGGEPDTLLRRAGILPGQVGQFDSFITYLALIDAMEAAAAATGAADFGRRLARRQGIDILGAVGVAARTPQTVADAFGIFEHYLAAYSPAISAQILPLADKELCFLQFKVLIAHPPAHPQVTELSLGVMLRVLRFLLGSSYAPIAVDLPHQPLTPQDEYLRYFSCAPRFGERGAGLTFPSADLGRSLTQDEVSHRAVLTYLDSMMDTRDGEMKTAVRALTRQLLPTGAATQDVVAQQFRLHPKTLQRRLAAEGTTFVAIVDDVRREMAQRYLRDTNMTLSHLARELGYAEHSVLTRACRRWYGSNPTVLRDNWRSASTQ
ncbi:AraC family transcriptional regulator [Mycolicibacterium celeriflavum]|nr:AraC family transcriptional regulator [Mycolicibacterium celeriflavum]MCV7238977.1 AraC family transcriptional regulator [Mycolicibacterium celeriflavum]ORA50573.1 AraC family transcriptional regulator [Mycolicibacterium celeriflavum]